jgi:hypothetical protein
MGCNAERAGGSLRLLVGFYYLRQRWWRYADSRLSRSAWETGSSELDLKQLAKDGYVNEEGYLNVGHLLGMPGDRGTRPSLYLSPLAGSLSLGKVTNH